MINIYQLLSEKVKSNPEKTAVKFENKSVSFQEFLLKVNQTAEYLLKNNYDNKKILLAMPRNTDLLVSIFAILKVNSTYIPIDLSYPTERINYIIDDSSCDCVLTMRSNQNRFSNLDIVCFEDTEMDIVIESHLINPKDFVSSLAYIIYTSGSTGNPKGVMIEEASLVNFIESMGSVIDFNDKKTIICLTTVSFDIFFLESIMALCKGLTVVLANEDEQNNPKLIKNLISKHNVDIVQLTPSRARQLLSYSIDTFSQVSEIIIGGEDFPVNLLKDLQINTKGKIYNLYGPTEATIWTTICDVTNEDEIVIGKALPGYETYVLDHNLKAVPNGEIGELCISGVGLSLGYINKEALTSQKFTSSKELGNIRIYRTGDSVKLLDDGNMKYVGRMDNQVKIRGYRVELEEIESIAYASGLISQVVVIVRVVNDINSLVLYYCSEQENVTEQLKDYLRNKLLDYMIPSIFIELTTMPQNFNGKIDRNVLSEMYIKNEELGTIPKEYSKELQLQDDDISHQIVEIIKTITERDYITPSSEMEEIDSISFIKILAEIENTFNITLSEETLMNNYFETVSDLIQHVTVEVEVEVYN
ncbi:non-ribosomal peptide synthetase [Lysinibacillus capsici]|uniref:non-ribosomal peptide synthetase n=1 Tax=Lysinibacillus capsici TaxID=2115968 RepID=UPI002E230808|nr:non-ribosomal peptide synthetase [Lysinibacillus capsici]